MIADKALSLDQVNSNLHWVDWSGKWLNDDSFKGQNITPMKKDGLVQESIIRGKVNMWKNEEVMSC